MPGSGAAGMRFWVSRRVDRELVRRASMVAPAL